MRNLFGSACLYGPYRRTTLALWEAGDAKGQRSTDAFAKAGFVCFTGTARPKGLIAKFFIAARFIGETQIAD